MGIRSLLRNAFGRSKATRDGSGAARDSTDKPESATIPEAREESTPAPAAAATPEVEVPAARTAPAEPAEPTPAPVTASLPAQSRPVERALEPAAKGEAPVRDEPAPTPEATKPTAEAPQPQAADKETDEGTEVVADQGTGTPEAPREEAATAKKLVEEPAVKDERGAGSDAVADAAPATTAPAAADSAADLVSQAFDTPATAAAPTAAEEATEPAPDAQPAQAKEKEEAPAADRPSDTQEAPTQAPVEQAQEESEKAKAEATPEVADAPAAAATEAADEPTPEPAPAAEVTEPVEATAPAETAEQAPATDAPHPVAAVAPALLPLYDAARATLEKHQLTQQRATVYLVLDRSGSMRNYYKDGTVQHLAEQALSLSAHFDDKATVPVVFFSTDVDGTADLDLTTYEGRIEELHSGLGHMGRTNYHWAIEAVVEHYKKSGSAHPAFVIFQTDGAPTSKPAAERALCEAAGLPIFWQFIGFGDPEAKGFDFLRKLDDLTVPEKRVVDNAGFFHAGRDPRGLSHDELYQQLMVEFPEWLTEARTAKVLKDS
ncbi:vWA domain-containing protein [Streptomyces noursei]|uniref:vWA domain-containing protein n=1 Tax=Streptomyces noursei TaxID=1971 RepID=UPI00167460E9|nr:VWA domain-containing protein [Streptomyces noursei]MCZ1016795.1 VWA domain-containing protein [Streptomyces noursei]GGX07051.1 hypothetical protein GCM10010341_30760 [Streptomyces noursei]